MPIKHLRMHNKNISQKDLAKELNITPSYLSKIEHGIKTPSFELGLRIAMILNVCPFALCDEYTKKLLKDKVDKKQYNLCQKCYTDIFDNNLIADKEKEE